MGFRGFAAGERAAMKAAGGRGLTKAFTMLGTPSMRQALGKGGARSSAQALRSGRRRAGVVGGALALNAAVGPNGSRSSGGSGNLAPRSMGGYA